MMYAAAARPLRRFHRKCGRGKKERKAFLFANLYRHPDVVRVRKGADQIVRDLFGLYFADPRAMPEGWREGLDAASDAVKARHVADFWLA